MTQALFQQVIESPLSKGEKRKSEIIEAAILCIQQEGIEKTTFERIGQKLGIRKAHVSYHFPNKDVIIEYAIQYVYACATRSVAEEMAKAKKEKDFLRCYVDGNFEWIAKYPEQRSTIMLFQYYSTYHELYQYKLREVRQKGQERLFEILSTLHRRRKTTEKQLKERSLMIQDLMTGSIIAFLTTVDFQKDIRRELAHAKRRTYEMLYNVAMKT